MTFNINQVREKNKIKYPIRIRRDAHIQPSKKNKNIRNSKKNNQNMQQRTTTIKHKRDSMQQKTYQTRDRQNNNKIQQQNILARIGTVRDSINTIHARSNLAQYCSTNVDTKNDHDSKAKGYNTNRRSVIMKNGSPLLKRS